MTRNPLNLLPVKWVFITFLFVVSVTTFVVFISGLTFHRSLLQNGFISYSIVSCCFFIFISEGLFFGVKLKDNVGDLTRKLKWTGSGDGIELADEGLGILGFELGEGLGGILLEFHGGFVQLSSFSRCCSFLRQ